ncbi:MAG: histidine phosphatase family protein, partial [Deltaproteobacteria bacterium]
GEWEGRMVAEVMQLFSQEKARDGFDPATFRPPGGESISEVAIRVANVADEITRSHPQGKVLLVSHGLAVATLVCQVNGIPLSKVYENIPDNAHPRVITWVMNSSDCLANKR